MLGEAMVAFKGVSLAAGMAGKVVGNFADRASSRAGATASGSSGFLQGGLAGVVSRKITNDAVRTATQTTQKASSSTMSAAHQATERTVNAERQAASVVHQAKQMRSESASQKSQMGVTHQQVASSTRTASVSSLRRESQHSVGLGGRIFTNSMLEGGRFANDVIGMVAAGDLHSTGSITGEFASQALSSYMALPLRETPRRKYPIPTLRSAVGASPAQSIRQSIRRAFPLECTIPGNMPRRTVNTRRSSLPMASNGTSSMPLIP